jgi:mannitol/fructose-specific phosphotransferase system IIA component (Ntr-type)
VIRLADYLAPERVIDLRSRSKDAALLELVETLRGTPDLRDVDAVLQAVSERERVLSTGIGLGVAVPHAKIAGVPDFLLAYGRSREGIDFGSIDDRPVHHVVMIVGPQDRQPRYLQFLASVTLTLKRAELRQSLETASGPADLFRILVSEK